MKQFLYIIPTMIFATAIAGEDFDNADTGTQYFSYGITSAQLDSIPNIPDQSLKRQIPDEVVYSCLFNEQNMRQTGGGNNFYDHGHIVLNGKRYGIVERCDYYSLSVWLFPLDSVGIRPYPPLFLIYSFQGYFDRIFKLNDSGDLITVNDAWHDGTKSDSNGTQQWLNRSATHRFTIDSCFIYPDFSVVKGGIQTNVYLEELAAKSRNCVPRFFNAETNDRLNLLTIDRSWAWRNIRQESPGDPLGAMSDYYLVGNINLNGNRCYMIQVTDYVFNFNTHRINCYLVTYGEKWQRPQLLHIAEFHSDSNVLMMNYDLNHDRIIVYDTYRNGSKGDIRTWYYRLSDKGFVCDWASDDYLGQDAPQTICRQEADAAFGFDDWNVDAAPTRYDGPKTDRRGIVLNKETAQRIFGERIPEGTRTDSLEIALLGRAYLNNRPCYMIKSIDLQSYSEYPEVNIYLVAFTVSGSPDILHIAEARSVKSESLNGKGRNFDLAPDHILVYRVETDQDWNKRAVAQYYTLSPDGFREVTDEMLFHCDIIE